MDSTVVTKAIDNGTKIIAGPLTCISKSGPNNSNINPFKIKVPIPNVKTRNGIKILVNIGHNNALIKLINKTNNAISSKPDNETPIPKKLTKYNPITFPINMIKLLLNDTRGGFSKFSIRSMLSPYFLKKIYSGLRFCLE